MDIQEERISDIGEEAEKRESILSAHACFLIKNLSQRDEHVRDITVNILTQLKERFPQVSALLLRYGSFANIIFELLSGLLKENSLMHLQVLWNSSCLDALLFSVHNDLPSSQVNDPAWIATVRSLYQKIAREWITTALSYAPCTTQGLLQVCSNSTFKIIYYGPFSYHFSLLAFDIFYYLGKIISSLELNAIWNHVSFCMLLIKV